MVSTPRGRPFLHSGLGISVEVPEAWSVEGTAIFPLQLFAPETDGYRSNLMFSHERFSPPTPEGVAAFMSKVRAEQVEQYPGFCRLDEAEQELDGHPALLQHYRWQPGPPVPDMAQLLAFVVLEPGLLLQVDGATTASLAGELMPALDAVLRTVRIVGRPTPEPG